jgi:hypothetical protein
MFVPRRIFNAVIKTPILLLTTFPLGIGSDDGSDGWVSNVNMGAGRGPWHYSPEGDKRNPHLS